MTSRDGGLPMRSALAATGHSSNLLEDAARALPKATDAWAFCRAASNSPWVRFAGELSSRSRDDRVKLGPFSFMALDYSYTRLFWTDLIKSAIVMVDWPPMFSTGLGTGALGLTGSFQTHARYRNTSAK